MKLLNCILNFESNDNYLCFLSQNLKNRIRQEYKYQKDDHKYMEQKKRFEYLHKKLGHIKRLILEYDNSQVTVS